MQFWMHTFSSSSAWEPKGSRGLLLLIWPQKNTEETLSFLLPTVATATGKGCEGKHLTFPSRPERCVSHSYSDTQVQGLIYSHEAILIYSHLSRKRGYPVLIHTSLLDQSHQVLHSDEAEVTPPSQPISGHSPEWRPTCNNKMNSNS